MVYKLFSLWYFICSTFVCPGKDISVIFIDRRLHHRYPAVWMKTLGEDGRKYGFIIILNFRSNISFQTGILKEFQEFLQLHKIIIK